MRRALLYVVWMAALIAPTHAGAQEAMAVEGGPWWLRVLFFVVSLPYTLYMVFVDGQQLHLLPAPLLGVALCFWSFREWRRQGFWTPRVIHVLAVLGLATIIMINVAWVRAGGEMWTQRYVVVAIFGLFPYVAYLLFLGPRYLGRRRPVVRDSVPRTSDEAQALAGTLPDQSWISAAPSSGGRTGFRTLARGLGVVAVVAVSLIMAVGSFDATSVARPELDALRAPESLVPMARGVAKGDPEARFTILVFGDYQCPACERFARRVQPRIDSAFVETSRASFVFFDLPLVSVHANAFVAARAAHCAEDQERFWAYQDELYRNQAEWSSLPAPSDAFEEVAGAVGLDRVAFRSCLDGDRHADLVEANQELARTLGIRSTPTIVISRGDGAVREVNRNSFRSIARTLEEMESSRPAT